MCSHLPRFLFSAVLTSLNLRSNSLDAEAGKALAGALSVNRVLTNLDLSHNPLRGINLYTNQGTYDPSGIQALASALAGSAVLNKIVLSYNTIKDEGAIAFGEALTINKSLKELDLEHCEIGAEGGKALAAALSEGSRVLTSLDVGSNRRLNEAAALAIVRAARQHDKIAILSLEFCEIGPSRAKEIAEYVRGSAVLSFINIFGNAIGDEGMRAIGTAILSSSTSKLGALKCDAFDLGPNVASLDLSRKDISSAVVTLLAGVIKFNAVLTSLDLNNNTVGPEGAKALANALQVNAVLTSLNLFDNDVGPEGAKGLADALRVKAMRTKLNVRHSGLRNEDKKALQNAAKGRKGFNLII